MKTQANELNLLLNQLAGYLRCLVVDYLVNNKLEALDSHDFPIDFQMNSSNSYRDFIQVAICENEAIPHAY